MSFTGICFLKLYYYHVSSCLYSVYLINLSYVIRHQLIVIYVFDLTYVSDIRTVDQYLILFFIRDIPSNVIDNLYCSSINLILISNSTNTLDRYALDEISKVLDKLVSYFRSIKPEVNYGSFYEIRR